MALYASDVESVFDWPASFSVWFKNDAYPDNGYVAKTYCDVHGSFFELQMYFWKAIW